MKGIKGLDNRVNPENLKETDGAIFSNCRVTKDDM